jgi:hypothetical protein
MQLTHTWMNNQEDQPIYVLYGIASDQPLQRRWQGARRVGGHWERVSSSQGMRTLERLQTFTFTTVTYHLSSRYPVIAEQINATLEKVTERDPIQQFNFLIAKPL